MEQTTQLHLYVDETGRPYEPNEKLPITIDQLNIIKTTIAEKYGLNFTKDVQHKSWYPT